MKKWEYLTVPLIVHTTKAIMITTVRKGGNSVAVLPGAPATKGPNPAGNMVAPTRVTPSPTSSARLKAKAAPRPVT